MQARGKKEFKIIATVRQVEDATTSKNDPYKKIGLVQKGEDQANTWSYFSPPLDLNITEGRAYEFVVSSPDTPRGAPSRNIEALLGEAEIPAAETAAAMSIVSEEDKTRDSIQRQTALKSAEQITSAKIKVSQPKDPGALFSQKFDEQLIESVLRLADGFMSHLSGDVPKATENRSPAPTGHTRDDLEEGW